MMTRAVGAAAVPLGLRSCNGSPAGAVPPGKNFQVDRPGRFASLWVAPDLRPFVHVLKAIACPAAKARLLHSRGQSFDGLFGGRDYITPRFGGLTPSRGRSRRRKSRPVRGKVMVERS